MIVVVAVVALLVGIAIGLLAPRIQKPQRAVPEIERTRHILLPFTATTLSRRALTAAIRLASVEDAVLMPAFLATVPLTLPLDSPLPRQASVGMPLLEAIEQRAVASGVAVDSRVQAGRSYRHALDTLLEHQRFDRVIVSASEDLQTGLSGNDLVWLLTHTNAEVMILRPAREDTAMLGTADFKGHF